MELWEIEELIYLEEQHFKLIANLKNKSILLQDEVAIKKNIMSLSQELRKVNSKGIENKVKIILLKRRLQKLYLKVNELNTIYH